MAPWSESRDRYPTWLVLQSSTDLLVLPRVFDGGFTNQFDAGDTNSKQGIGGGEIGSSVVECRLYDLHGVVLKYEDYDTIYYTRKPNEAPSPPCLSLSSPKSSTFCQFNSSIERGLVSIGYLSIGSPSLQARNRAPSKQ